MKKKYGKGLLLFLLLCMFAQCNTVCIAAKGEIDLKIETLPNVEDDGSFFVRLSVQKIDPNNGLIGATFHVHYDSALTQLVSWENQTPNGWNFDGTNAEDRTKIVETDSGTYLMFTQLQTDENAAVTKDGELQTTLRFKTNVKELDSIELRVTDICLISADAHTDPIRLPDKAYTVSIPDFFNSTENEGKALKITIAVLASLAVLGASVCTFTIARKREIV